MHIIRIMFQVVALLATLELQDSPKRKGHFALYNCLVLGHTKYSGTFSRGGVLAHCRGFGTCGWKDAGTRRLGARLVGVARAWHGPTLNASGGTALLCLSLSHLCWHEDSSRVGEWPDSDTR